MARELCVVGGAGHVGLPLAIVFASKGVETLCYDRDAKAIAAIAEGRMPFVEEGAEPLLREVLASGKLRLSADPEDVDGVATVIVTIGTPVDEFMNPKLAVIWECLEDLLPYLGDDQLLVFRSTVYPGTTERIASQLAERGRAVEIAYCPERIVQGRAIAELETLPQIVSGTTPGAETRAADVFARIAPSIVRLSPTEAEFAKLFTNAYRYIQFAAANQFWTIAQAAGVDYHRVLAGMQQDYPRAQDLPGAGFTAGPCLLKDTLQLVSFNDNQFSLGSAAMLVNEGLPLSVVNLVSERYDLSQMTVGLLGMAFKADIDDIRSSLSYKLKKLLAFRAKRVLTTDPHVVTDDELLPLARVVADSDLLIVCTPHSVYRELGEAELAGTAVVDVWNLLGGGAGL